MSSSLPPIRSWPVQERPRERLASLGPGALSVRELLAILVGSGGAGGSALEIADRILLSLEPAPPPAEGVKGGTPARQAGPGSSEGLSGLRRLATLAPRALEAQRGVGPATAIRIVAALELGRRVAAEPFDHGAPILGPADVYQRLGPLLRDLRQEEFHALFLDTQHRLMRDALLTRGILDASLIHPREVFRAALLESAAGIILVHNHPSGDPTPSGEDRRVTRLLAAAGATLGIPVLDHVIVGSGGFTSLAQEGELKRMVSEVREGDQEERPLPAASEGFPGRPDRKGTRVGSRA